MTYWRASKNRWMQHPHAAFRCLLHILAKIHNLFLCFFPLSNKNKTTHLCVANQSLFSFLWLGVESHLLGQICKLALHLRMVFGICVCASFDWEVPLVQRHKRYWYNWYNSTLIDFVHINDRRITHRNDQLLLHFNGCTSSTSLSGLESDADYVKLSSLCQLLDRFGFVTWEK